MLLTFISLHPCSFGETLVHHPPRSPIGKGDLMKSNKIGNNHCLDCSDNVQEKEQIKLQLAGAVRLISDWSDNVQPRAESHLHEPGGSPFCLAISTKAQASHESACSIISTMSPTSTVKYSSPETVEFRGKLTPAAKDKAVLSLFTQNEGWSGVQNLS